MPKYTSFKALEDENSKSKSSYFSTEVPIIMGILNITQDSFFDGGKYKTERDIVKRCEQMLEEGATIIDIGAQSSRPGAKPISAKNELRKLLPIIKLLKNKFPKLILSVDTYWAKVAEECVNAGADIINDISAGELDEKMIDTIAKLQVPYIIMHMQGEPSTMQKNPTYTNVTSEIINYFEKKIKELKNKKIHNIVIDPGFGFGKNINHNYKLLNNLEKFKKFKIPILVGFSRKSMIYNLLDNSAKESLNGTSILNTIALRKGAKILRVHDVKEAVECIKITTFSKNNR